MTYFQCKEGLETEEKYKQKKNNGKDIKDENKNSMTFKKSYTIFKILKFF